MAERILSGVTPNGINGSGITSTSIQMSEEINQTAPSGSESAGHCSNKEKRCKVISNRITKSKKVLVPKRKVKRFGTKTTIITGLAIKQEKLTMEEFNSLKNEGYRKAEEGNSSEGSDHEKEEESKEKSKMILEPEEEDEIKTEEDLVEIEAEIFDINDI